MKFEFEVSGVLSSQQVASSKKQDGFLRLHPLRQPLPITISQPLAACRCTLSRRLHSTGVALRLILGSCDIALSVFFLQALARSWPCHIKFPAALLRKLSQQVTASTQVLSKPSRPQSCCLHTWFMVHIKYHGVINNHKKDAHMKARVIIIRRMRR